MFDSELSIIGGPTTTSWTLTAPLVWTGSQGDTFTVPAGFVTDFATVPRFLHWLVLPYGAYTRSAVLHDYLLSLVADVEGRAAWRAGQPSPYAYGSQPIKSRDADAIFRKTMHELGVGWLKRWAMWTAVRWASLFNPRRAYGRAIAADLPRMLLVTVAALATVVIPVAALAVAVALLFVRLLTWVTPPVRQPRRGARPAGPSKGKS